MLGSPEKRDFLRCDPVDLRGGDRGCRVAALEDRAQSRASPVKPRSNRALSRRETSRNLVQPEILGVVEGHDAAVILGERVERAPHFGVALAGLGRRVAARRVVVVRRAKVAELLEIEPVDQPRPVAALRPHQHERLVGRHPEKPGGEARVATEAPHPTDDLHQRGLQQIPPVVIREGVTKELLLDVRCDRRDELVQSHGVARRCPRQHRLIDCERHDRSFCDHRAG